MTAGGRIANNMDIYELSCGSTGRKSVIAKSLFQYLKKPAFMRFFGMKTTTNLERQKIIKNIVVFRFSCHTANKKAATKSTSLPQFYLICYVKINYFLFCKNVGTSKSSLALDLRLLEESTSSA